MTSLDWSDDIEDVLESIRSNAAIMSKHHKKNYLYYKGQLKYYRIPVIIISGFNSVIAVGLQPYMDQGLISASNCLLALICGIIGSIELFLGLQTSMESELIASRNFYLLAIDIYKTITLDRGRRMSSGKDYLEEKYSEYTKLFGNAQLLRCKMTDSLATTPLSNKRDDDSEISSLDLEIGINEDSVFSNMKNAMGVKNKFGNTTISFNQKMKEVEDAAKQTIESVENNAKQKMKEMEDAAKQKIESAENKLDVILEESIEE